MTSANVVFSGPADKVYPISREKQVASGSTILPGNLVEDNGSGEWQLQSTAGAGGPVYIADMNTIEQKSVTEALTEGQNHKAFVAEVGCTYNVILADGNTISAGDLLSADGSGAVTAATEGTATPDVALFVAEEAVTTSGSTGRIRARFINSALKAAS
jgi:hypothetical protein